VKPLSENFKNALDGADAEAAEKMVKA